jgi:pimeloyl-ACP methyl ester carboxylesterase
MKGEGDPIVFSHGWTCDRTVWDSQVDLLSKTHKVITYDQRGHGKSSKPENDYSMDTLAMDLYGLLKGLKLDKVTLVGHSMGGFTALSFVRDHPEMVSKLVLVDTSARFSYPLRFQFWLLSHTNSYEKLNLKMIDMLHADGCEPAKQRSLQRVRNTPKNVVLTCSKEFLTNYDVRRSTPNIKVPTLILVGGIDKMTPVSYSRFLNHSIEGSQMTIVPGSRHMTMIDNAKEVNAAIEAFLA